MTVPASEVALSGLTLLRIVNSLVVLQCSVQADEIDIRSSSVSACGKLGMRVRDSLGRVLVGTTQQCVGWLGPCKLGTYDL